MLEPYSTPLISLKTIKTALTAVFLLCLAGLFIVSGWLISYAKTPGPSDKDTLVVNIPKGTSVKNIGKILGEAGANPF